MYALRRASRSGRTTTTARSPRGWRRLGADLLVRALDERPTPVEQDEALRHLRAQDRRRASARWTRRRRPRRSSARSARCGRTSAPGCRCPTARFLGVLAARVDGPDAARPPAACVRTDGDRLLLDCHGGALELTEIRPPGGRPMAAADWLRGRPDPALVDFRFDPALPDRALDEVLERARAEWADPRRRVAAARVRARRPRQPRRARRDGRAGRRRRPADRELAAYVLGQLGTASARVPGRAGRGAARDGRARARPGGARRRSPARSATSATPHGQALAAGAARPRRPRRARGGRVRARRPHGRRGPRRADRALRPTPQRRARLGDVRARHARRRGRRRPLRDALAARLDDPDEDTRLEAVHGLALRGDHARRRRRRASCSPRTSGRTTASGRATCWPRRPSHLEAVDDSGRPRRPESQCDAVAGLPGGRGRRVRGGGRRRRGRGRSGRSLGEPERGGAGAGGRRRRRAPAPREPEPEPGPRPRGGAPEPRSGPERRASAGASASPAASPSGPGRRPSPGRRRFAGACRPWGPRLRRGCLVGARRRRARPRGASVAAAGRRRPAADCSGGRARPARRRSALVGHRSVASSRGPGRGVSAGGRRRRRRPARSARPRRAAAVVPSVDRAASPPAARPSTGGSSVRRLRRPAGRPRDRQAVRVAVAVVVLQAVRSAVAVGVGASPGRCRCAPRSALDTPSPSESSLPSMTPSPLVSRQRPPSGS